jgi:acetylornithine/succinyldiaminopimelate/putrescine aminotransferase
VKNIQRSLKDLLNPDYAEAVVKGAAQLGGIDERRAERLVAEPISFFDEDLSRRLDELVERIGEPFCAPFRGGTEGSPTDSFRKASNRAAAPITGLGFVRLGEDGRLYMVSKSEHYHTPLGHNFGGYRLIDNARALGIVNATHNNTRGHITRLLEREIVRTINGLDRSQRGELEATIASREAKVLNRVLNLETGSLACEAALKMMLLRFYKLDETYPERKYAGKTPVFLVIADNDGGAQANYHGTTIFAQTLRDLWPSIRSECEAQGIYKVVSVRINDIGDFARKMEQYNRGDYKTSGFIHEIILMNYGGVRLKEEYLRSAYELCARHDTPTMADEIQSCMWYRGMYLSREYGLRPDFVIIGKGFSGGEYPASKVITTAEMDTLNQFGALVTNGQEELASLAYLVTMEFVQANGDEIARMGAEIESLFEGLAARHPSLIQKIEGKGHLQAIHLREAKKAIAFVRRLQDRCIDISAQTYKANFPLAALLKLPLVFSEKALARLVAEMDTALSELTE